MNEADHVPLERIGYTEALSTIEYGVFEDRRSKGLGFALVQTTEDRQHADEVIARSSELPRFLRQRTVIHHPWTHVGPDGGGDRG